MKRIAVVCASGIGDALIYMVLSHNLRVAGFSVVTFSSALEPLKSWFPGQTILPLPSSLLLESQLGSFDQIIASDHSLLSQTTSSLPITWIRENCLDRKKTYVDNLLTICKDTFSIPTPQKEIGITPPSPLIYRSVSHRVIIHPMSLEEKRCWPKDKFLKLANQLLENGWLPALVMHPSERPPWESLLTSISKEIYLPQFHTLAELAGFLYESGWLIGNNSGLGHLASSLHIPTVSIFARKSYAHLWRPGWRPGIIVTPPHLFIGANWMDRYWKQLLHSKRVFKAFKKFSESSL